MWRADLRRAGADAQQRDHAQAGSFTNSVGSAAAKVIVEHAGLRAIVSAQQSHGQEGERRPRRMMAFAFGFRGHRSKLRDLYAMLRDTGSIVIESFMLLPLGACAGARVINVIGVGLAVALLVSYRLAKRKASEA